MGERALTGTFADAATFAELAVLATAWSGTEKALRLAGADNLAGKVVIDATNPLAFAGPGQPPGLALGHTDSGGEQVQRWLPEARVVKAFNIVGNANMVTLTSPAARPTCSFAGMTRRPRPSSPRSSPPSAGRRSTSAGSKEPGCWSRCASSG